MVFRSSALSRCIGLLQRRDIGGTVLFLCSISPDDSELEPVVVLVSQHRYPYLQVSTVEVFLVIIAAANTVHRGHDE